jgi:hypothetical protein
LQYANFSYEEDNFPDLEPTAVIFRYGVIGEKVGYGEQVGIEVRIGLGLSKGDDSVSDPLFGDTDIDIEIDSLLGLYWVSQHNTGSAAIYGLVGASIINATTTDTIGDAEFSYPEDVFPFSFGIGVNFGKVEGIQFNLEYMSYLDTDEFSYEAVSLGVMF